MKVIAVAMALSSLALGAPASAHHSSAGVDFNQKIVVEGTLKDFDYSAPHAAVIVVGKVDGKVVETKIWTVSPTQLHGQGFAPKDFHPGEKVTLVYYPNRNGLPGGIMASLKLGSGRVVQGSGPR